MNEGKRKLWDRLYSSIFKKYRVVIYNETSLQERASVALSPMNIISLLMILVSITFLVSYFLFFFTPLKETIIGKIGSGDVDPEQVYQLQRRADSLEKEIIARDDELKSLKRMLKGNDSISSFLVIPGHNSNNQFRNFGFKPFSYIFVSEPVTAQNQQTLPPQQGKPITANMQQSTVQAPFMFPPAKGFISNAFSIEREHFGVDIVGIKNAPVKATLDGTVVFADWTASTGNVIILQHSNDLISIYKHNSVLLKKIGNFVHSGEVIALMGNSGEYTSGPHLHFEVWSKGSPMNPEDFISF